MDLTAVIQLGVGMAILSAGGHYLVEGATRLALLARISSAAVGLTVVALGTSMPELAVSLGAAMRGAKAISYANVVGSNIINIGVILGIAALLRAIPVPRQTIRLEYPFMLAATIVCLLVARDGDIDRLEGGVFVVAIVAFLTYMVRRSRGETDTPEARELARTRIDAGGGWGPSIAMISLGVVGLAAGAELMVRGAVTLADAIGVTQRVIGLTVIAMGTSLPELATCIVAARRNASDILLGNIVGSNIFNLLGILGITALLVEVPLDPEAVTIDNWVMLGFAAGLFPLMAWGRRLAWGSGTVLLVAFVIYLIELIRDAM
ncbi:MAG TPA: calcium/sodium antiporter [Gemmatimonadales bacterium]